MAFVCNACSGCTKELNAQMQALQSRIKTLERTAATHQTLTKISLIKTIAAFIAAGQATAAAILSTDPQVILAVLGEIAWEELMALIPALDFQALMANMAIENLCLPPFDDAIIALVAAKMTSKMEAAEAALAAGIAAGLSAELLADLAAAVACLSVAAGGLGAGGFHANQNRLSKCGTASSIVRAATGA